MPEHEPPGLTSLDPVLRAIPPSLLPWIAKSHVQYLDDRIHKINVLSEYLANCAQVEPERLEFISFVDGWTRREDTDLASYLGEYAARFAHVRAKVEEQCERVLTDTRLWENRVELVSFWKQFAYFNEVDSLHGMFLTSGRWHVNVMLPAVKELVYCSLPEASNAASRNETAYLVARRVITPRFAKLPDNYDYSLEQRFARLFVPVLQYYDRKLLFLFEVMAAFPFGDGYALEDLVKDVSRDPSKYATLLNMGVYPPFAWHELVASRRARRPAPTYANASRPLMESVRPDYQQRASRALASLAAFKSYELNYNNYNSKGRFGLVSKYLYWRTNHLLPEASRASFLDAILGDRFFEALNVVERTLSA